jgi:4-hydroxybenzoate polyprenyltransferase
MKGSFLYDLLKAMRPNQWTKNVVVLAAFSFALWDRSADTPLTKVDFIIALAATLAFCITSSAVYIFNDIRDVASDRNHPVKRNRPIAAGKIPIRTAYTASGILFAIGIAASLLLSPAFAGVVAVYILLQLAYSLGLKRIALVDIVFIAVGFVLRAIGGAVVINVHISPWLLLCTFLLALFLALCKRRHEKLTVEEPQPKQRISLGKYNRRLLDTLIAIVGLGTIVSYAMYTQAPQTVEKFQTRLLGLTIPFVVVGIVRYLDLVYHHKKGDRPERILLTDIPTLINLALYGTAVLIILKTTAS